MNQPHISSLGLVLDSKSPFWIAQWTLSDGTRQKKSTKVPVAGGLFNGERLSRVQSKNRALAIAHALADASLAQSQQVAQLSCSELFELMLKGKLGRVSVATYDNARATYKFFTDWLGKKASAPIISITKATIKEWVLYRRSQVRYATCRKDLAAISQACKDAVDAEIIDRNPCQGVAIPADRAGEKRIKEAFTLDEIRYMIDKFPPQWSSAVRCSFETFGQRLGDILRLDWSQFDWNARVVRFVTGKTGRVLAQPMRDGFYTWAHAEWQKAGCPESGLLHPDLLPLGDGASYQFGLLLRTHGIGMLHGSFGGRRRAMNSKSFHSIRATCATLLHASGVSQGMAMELVGHDSQEVHTVYIRPTSDQLREAANNMPAL